MATTTLGTPRRPLVVGVLSLLLVAGCKAPPGSYAARTYFPHKDVACISVYLDEKLDADSYLSIARDEMEELLSAPPPTAVPIYQVRFEFYLPEAPTPARKRVAEVSLFPQDPESWPWGRSPPEVSIY